MPAICRYENGQRLARRSRSLRRLFRDIVEQQPLAKHLKANLCRLFARPFSPARNRKVDPLVSGGYFPEWRVERLQRIRYSLFGFFLKNLTRRGRRRFFISELIHAVAAAIWRQARQYPPRTGSRNWSLRLAAAFRATVRNAERGQLVKRSFLEFIAGGLGVALHEIVLPSCEFELHLRWRRHVDRLMAAPQRVVTEHDASDALDLCTATSNFMRIPGCRTFRRLSTGWRIPRSLRGRAIRRQRLPILGACPRRRQILCRSPARRRRRGGNSRRAAVHWRR